MSYRTSTGVDGFQTHSKKPRRARQENTFGQHACCPQHRHILYHSARHCLTLFITHSCANCINKGTNCTTCIYSMTIPECNGHKRQNGPALEGMCSFKILSHFKKFGGGFWFHYNNRLFVVLGTFANKMNTMVLSNGMVCKFRYSAEAT